VQNAFDGISGSNQRQRFSRDVVRIAFAVIGRFDDARPRRIGVRHVDGEKLRGRAYAEEGHSFFLFLCPPFVNVVYRRRRFVGMMMMMVRGEESFEE